jgi:hypothetical protein
VFCDGSLDHFCPCRRGRAALSDGALDTRRRLAMERI